MLEKEELREFALWIFEQRAIDINFYGVGCIDKLVEYYLEEKYGKL